MRGVTCRNGSIRFQHDLPKPTPRAGEELLRVRLSGICDTDLQLARGYMGFQGIPGHEFVAQTSSGQRVTAEINNACHQCEICFAGRANHCPRRTVTGILNHDGAMAEWVAVPSRNLHRIPDAISDLEAVFVEPLAAALRMTEQVTVRPGLRTAVVGDGKLGILCAWVLRDAGADVHLVGKHPAKLALAGDSIKPLHLEEAKQLAKRFELLVDATGSASGLSTALALVEACGTVVLKTTIAAAHEISLAPVVIDEVRVIGSRCGPFANAIEALSARRFDVTRLIGAEFPAEQAELAFQAAALPGARKVLIHF